MSPAKKRPPAKRGPGRPRIKHPRRHVISVRLSTAELATLTRAAEASGEAIGEWARRVLLAGRVDGAGEGGK